MAKVNYPARLRHLRDHELSLSSSKNKQAILSGYHSLVDTLLAPQVNRYLHGQHDLLFQCISQIFLSPAHQNFDDDQLKVLLETASNSRLLTMSQNQVIDTWYQNIDERTFDEPEDLDDDDEDEDDWSDDTSESEDQKSATLLHPFAVAPAGPKKKNSVTFAPATEYPRPKQEVRSPPGKRQPNRPAPFDNKYGVNLQLYDCYICGEFGHVRYDCPKKQKPSAESSSTPKNKRPSTALDEKGRALIEQVYNDASKLLNGCPSPEDRKKTFEALLGGVQRLSKDYEDAVSPVFREKESTFYPLLCHIAQNEFLFTDDQYLRIYRLRQILLPRKHQSLNNTRLAFARQRPILSLTSIAEHIKTVSQIQQTIFNDFQEHIVRSKAPISPELFELIKHFLKSTIHVDPACFEHLTTRILFDKKKLIFSEVELADLQSAVEIRTHRLQRNQQKQVWKDRLNQLKNETLAGNLKKWLLDFGEILRTDQSEGQELTGNVVDHAMWYFAVLSMASSGHLNGEQYETLLKQAMQSSLFNTNQKCYLQFYLDRGQAPITMKELEQVKRQLEREKPEEKQEGLAQLKAILERDKPELRSSDEVIPVIDNHVLGRLISLAELISSAKQTFSTEQCHALLDTFLQQSRIVRPLSSADQQRLKSFYSHCLSLNELKAFCSSASFNAQELLSLLKQRTLVTDEEVLDFLTLTFTKIFEDRGKYSDEHCRDLKAFVEKRIFGKKRFQLLNQVYLKARGNAKVLPTEELKVLNQLLTNILQKDHQAHLDFFIRLEKMAEENDSRLDFEALRCLLSAIILVITEPSGIDVFRDRLKTLIDKRKEFFSLLLTEQQLQLVQSRLVRPTVEIDALLVDPSAGEPLVATSASATPKSLDPSVVHREMFRLLSSDDSESNTYVVDQLKQILVDEKPSSLILMPKFIQALDTVIKKPKKFPQVSLDEWQRLITRNRGKVFTNDNQCDQLLMSVVFSRLNLSVDSMAFVYGMIQSRRAKERQDGLKKLLLLLRNTSIRNDGDKGNTPPTIADELYQNLLNIVFDEIFSDQQVRQCLAAAKNSWLLSDEHRRKLQEI